MYVLFTLQKIHPVCFLISLLKNINFNYEQVHFQDEAHRKIFPVLAISFKKSIKVRFENFEMIK